MNKLLILLVTTFMLYGCNKNNVSLSPVTIKTEAGNVTYNIETATTESELEKGLMYRESLAADSGMIFDLSPYQDRPAIMWMKNTKISLDMLFMDQEGKIFFIKENTTPMSEELIIAPAPTKAVLELNAGEVQKHQIKIGQQVEHALFKKETK